MVDYLLQKLQWHQVCEISPLWILFCWWKFCELDTKEFSQEFQNWCNRRKLKPSEPLFEMWLNMVQDLLHADKRVEGVRVPQNARQHPSSSSAPNQDSSASAQYQQSSSSAPIQQYSSSAPSRQVPARRNRRKKRKNPPIDGAKIMKSLLKNLNRWNRSKLCFFSCLCFCWPETFLDFEFFFLNFCFECQELK